MFVGPSTPAAGGGRPSSSIVSATTPRQWALVLVAMIVVGTQTTTTPVEASRRRILQGSDDNTCLEVSDLPGCSIPECEDAVCSSGDLSTCCDDAWTEACTAEAIESFTDICEVPPPNNNCYQTDPLGRPGCSDEACQLLVCQDLPRCCNDSYSSSCVEYAIQNCDHPGATEGSNHCFETADGTVDSPAGCHDEKCLEAVCLSNSRCCAENYRESCVDIARELGAESCVPIKVDNTCYETSPVGGCNQPECERVVCFYFPECCNSDDGVTGEYDSACVASAEDVCQRLEGSGPANTCFETSSVGSCSDEQCLEQVCNERESCCTAAYDQTCVQIARTNLANCTPPADLSDNSCLQTSAFGGCDNQLCEAQVCGIRPVCCASEELNSVGEWSSECVAIAEDTCTLGGLNSCFEAVKTPSCSDQACADLVCMDDDFCCQRQWDKSCVAAASANLDTCTNGWPDQSNTCFEAEPFQRPGCSDTICQILVCDENPECCSDSYSDDCVDIALQVCELPTPLNSCFGTSITPGCNSPKCLESVCDADPTCCTEDYGARCTELARLNGSVCFPPPATNPCIQKSSFGGCEDLRCAAIVCDLSSTCCNGAIVGEWGQFCVDVARELCQPPVLPRPDNVPCPDGFTCDLEYMSNCTELRDQYIDAFELGDIYGGIYCGVGRIGEGIINCPLGMYCPDPITMLPCPAGYYCPFKTAQPQILCENCSEGATSLTQDLYGYIILGIFVGLAAIYIAFTLLERYNSKLHERIVEMEKRIVSRTLHHKAHGDKEEKKILEKLRPKLELISRRLVKLEEVGSTSAMSTSTSSMSMSMSRVNRTTSTGLEIDGNDIKFDARRVFDILDADDSGDVSYEELNVILGLNEIELVEFIRRMNEMAGHDSSNNSVDRPTFVKYFLQALTETSNLTVSFEEAEAVFDEMSGSSPDRPVNTINMNKFYASSMSDFLSDTQIYEIIKRFKAILSENMERQGGPPSMVRVGSFARRGSTFVGGLGSGSLHGTPRRQSAMVTNRRQSMRRPSFGTTSVDDSGRRRSSIISGGGSAGGQRAVVITTINREDFVEHYPQLLMDIMLEDHEEDDVDLSGMPDLLGVDMCFQDLSLSINLGQKTVKVVDEVTGRIRAKTMTAIMGGSGAGKTSLLNALCGRAFYGETSGTIMVNGHDESIEDHKDSVGFVPQDDIVYPEMTVRENLIFSGRFRLPKFTSDEEIAELADETLANLGLARVADSLVGDVKRRGVSGGEKKRVNIGLELMALPSILFLDEPTSGLDASSALLVMKSLKHLVDKDSVTVVSVIHQPRKFIFDLFDSLVLLGVGGRMVYHGPTDKAEAYFNRLHYTLPAGESVADWLIDISSGRLEPDNRVAACKKDEKMKKKKTLLTGNANDLAGKKKSDEDKPLESSTEESNGTGEGPVATGETASPVKREKSVKINGVAEGGSDITDDDDETGSLKDESDGKPIVRSMSTVSLVSVRTTNRPETAGRVVTDENTVGKKGVTTGKVALAFEEAKQRRAWLYEEWNKYFDGLTDEQKQLYDPPLEYELPYQVEKTSLWNQFVNQFKRCCIVAWRNRFSKIIDLTIIVVAVIVITALDGTTEVSLFDNPEISYFTMVRPLKIELPIIFQELFAYSQTRQIQYPLKVGIILTVLLGLIGTRIVTDHRLEFFREAGSGYNLNAYFFAISIMSTVEHSLQVVIAAFFASWIRNPIASNASYYIHFLLLAWITIAWALLIPMVVPTESVTLVAGFFFAFCGLMFSGAFPPIQYNQIYEGGFSEIFAGWISPTRFFYEAIAVGEYRCLPEQSGYTILPSSVNRQSNTSFTILLGYAGHDFNAVRWSCGGWYWSVLPAILIGITVRYLAVGSMHAFYRGQQTKKSLWFVMRKSKRVTMVVVAYFLVFCGLFAVTTWSFVRDVPFEEPPPPTRAELLLRYGFEE
eukprot:CAMPEP_0113480212 /NCGR_PEP_ID=MMETSP0014_2-20120614/21752_1 /TAXON_ID=2857 /ORGANISM="Nitzschia sp." /LENGTH=1932 /DNA_ID=CAMNT_0000373621 /DNA_START=203 /DNA_END=6001 /DNA_ORIENTATION=- /assembly_acc=CAM_ASM_000159